MAYTTKEAVKSYIGVAVTTSDTLIDTLIAAAQKTIETYCGQVFEAAADTTRHFQANSIDYGGHVDGRDLVLDAPLCAITSVTNGDGTLVSASDYITEPRNLTPWYALRLKNSSNLRWTYDDDVESDTIAVVGKWAFSATAPADVALAALRLSVWYYRQRPNANDLDRAVAVDGAIFLPSKIPADVMTLLAPYKRGPG